MNVTDDVLGSRFRKHTQLDAWAAVLPILLILIKPVKHGVSTTCIVSHFVLIWLR